MPFRHAGAIPPVGLEPTTDGLPTTSAFAAFRSWSGLCLHPFWVLAVKSLHLRIAALGSALSRLSTGSSPTLTRFDPCIPARQFHLKVRYSTIELEGRLAHPFSNEPTERKDFTDFALNDLHCPASTSHTGMTSGPTDPSSVRRLDAGTEMGAWLCDRVHFMVRSVPSALVNTTSQIPR